MSGIVGSKLNIRGSGLVASYGTDGQHMLCAGAGVSNVFETVAAAGGKIGQCLSTTLSTNTSTTSATFVDIAGLAIAITPAASTSKIFITVGLSCGSQADYSAQMQIMRDSTAICINTDGAKGGSQPATTWQQKASSPSRVHHMAMNFLDSPSSTSEISYNVEWRETEGTTLYLNRAHTTSDSASYPWCASTITVMEVLA